jgi:hypothetical protein
VLARSQQKAVRRMGTENIKKKCMDIDRDQSAEPHLN